MDSTSTTNTTEPLDVSCRHYTHVETYADLASASSISSAGADRIAQLFNECINFVVQIPVWLVDDDTDRDLTTISGAQTLYVGTVENYSEDAWLFTQADNESFLPKSQVHVFHRGNSEFDVPQRGLDEYAVSVGDAR